MRTHGPDGYRPILGAVDHALWTSKLMRPDGGGALRRDDARNLLRRTLEYYVAHRRVRVWGWAMLPSRVELLLAVDDRSDAQSFLGEVFGYFTRRFNTRYDRSGPLMRSKFIDRVLVGSSAICEAIDTVHNAPSSLALPEYPGDEPRSSRLAYELQRDDGVTSLYSPWLLRRGVRALPRDGAHP